MHVGGYGHRVSRLEKRVDSRQVGLVGRHLDHHDQDGLVDQPQLEHLELDEPGPGMPDGDYRGPEVVDGVFGPPVVELRACLA